MASGEIRQHTVRIPRGNPKQNTSNDQALCTNWRKPSNSLRDFFKKHSSAVSKGIWLLSIIVAVALDPFFFYIPGVKNASTCLGIDNNLRIVVVVFRSFVDVVHTFLWRHHRLPLVDGQFNKIRAWTAAILAILPLPQVVIFAMSWQLLMLKLLKFIVLFQFVIRLCRIIPAYTDATRKSNILLIHTWFAAAFNLVMYTIASNVLGAFWYLRAVERNIYCWKGACNKNQTSCGGSLLCDHTSRYKEFLHKNCSGTKSFDYGIYEEAFETNIIETDTRFLDKLFNCFWWGLRNLSSYGQNLKTGSYLWDSFFAIVIATCGVVLFAFFIGNMQTYLQTKAPAKLERMKQKKRDLEGWNPFTVLPRDLKRELTFCEDRMWVETTEVNLETLLNNTPIKLRKKLKSCLSNDMFEKAFGNIPELANLRKRLQDKLLSLAKPLVFPEGSYILREGDPIYRFVYVVQGNLLSYSKHSTQTRVPVKHLSDGCLFGEELLQQLKQVAQQPHQAPDGSSLELPVASETIQAMTKVEAFVFSAKDLHNKLFTRYRGCLDKSQMTEDWATSTILAARQNRGKARPHETPRKGRTFPFRRTRNRSAHPRPESELSLFAGHTTSTQ